MSLKKIADKYITPLGKSILHNQGPAVFKGVFVNFLKKQTVSVDLVARWVRQDQCLWSLFREQDKEIGRKFVSALGGTDWFTADWVITAIADEFSGVASLIVNWPAARQWLERQVEDMKQNLTD